MSQEKIEKDQVKFEPVELKSFLGQKLAKEGENPRKIIPIGAVLFDDRKRLVLLGVGTDDDLRTHFLDTPECLSEDLFLNAGKRIQDLSNFKKLNIYQVDLAKSTITTAQSIRNRPSVFLKLPVVRPTDNIEDDFVAEEDEVVDLFTGQKGGILVFSGGGNPYENNALFFERKNGNLPSGDLLFFQPKESDSGINSLIGFHQFLQSLNDQFNNTASSLQIEAVAALEKSIENKTLNFDSNNVRGELFKTMVIVQVIDYERAPKSEILERLKQHLPEFRKSFWNRLFPFSESKIAQVKSFVNEAIEHLIYQPKTGGDEEKLKNEMKNIETSSNEFIVTSRGTSFNKEIVGNAREINNYLQTVMGRTLRLSIPNMYYGVDKEPMKKYLDLLVDFAKNASSSFEFDDSETLILEVLETNYVKNNPNLWAIINIGQRYEIANRATFPIGKRPSELLEDLIAQIIAKRVRK